MLIAGHTRGEQTAKVSLFLSPLFVFSLSPLSPSLSLSPHNMGKANDDKMSDANIRKVFAKKVT